MDGLFSSRGSGRTELPSGTPSQKSQSSSRVTSQQLDRDIASLICEFGEPAFFSALGRAVESLSQREIPMSKITWDPDLGWINIPEATIESWTQRFPGVNIRKELAEAHGWLVANPKNRKKRYRRFVESWFRRSQKGSQAYNQGHQTSGDGSRGFG